MRSAWLLRGGDVLASADVAESWSERVRGLASKTGFDGALLLMHARTAHSAAARFPLDVAFLDRDLVVVATSRLRPWSVALPRRGCEHVLEAQAGAFERWGLVAGDKVELRLPA